jgi:uncharacterized PurR-regulated membrane protein YhhQ (DUF165 family)
LKQLKVNVKIIPIDLHCASYMYFIILAVADAIRTSLGPRGMDKMVSSSFKVLVSIDMLTLVSFFRFSRVKEMSPLPMMVPPF